MSRKVGGLTNAQWIVLNKLSEGVAIKRHSRNLQFHWIDERGIERPVGKATIDGLLGKNLITIWGYTGGADTLQITAWGEAAVQA